MTRPDPYAIPLPEHVTDLRWVRPPEDGVLDLGRAVGLLRNQLSIDRGQSPAFDPATTLAAHEMGACGEAVFCWFYGIRWAQTIDGYTEIPDVAPDIEIRTASSWRGLKVRNAKKDPPKRRVTFVLHKDGSEWWYVSGLWIVAGIAQQRYPLTDPGRRRAPAHFVPKAGLSRNIEVLGHTIHVFEVEDGETTCYGGEPWRPS